MKSRPSFAVSFYIRRKRNRREYSIYCCLKIPELRTSELCILDGIKRNEWDLRKGRPKQTTDHLVKLSLYLDSIKAKLFEIYLDLKLTKGELSVQRIKNIYLGKGPQDYTIRGVINEAIENYEMELTPGSLKNYRTTRSYVEAFCKEKYKDADVRLKFLTYSFIDQLKSYILHHPLKTHDPCANNGCMKHLERLKKIITWAFEMRYIDRDVFASFKIKKNPYEGARRLNWKQFKELESRSFQCDMLNLVKDIFIFCCYTGMAPVDVQRLEPHQIYLGADSVTWMTYFRAKSKVPAYVPLLKPAVELLKKYQLKRGDLFRKTVFPFVSNQILNRNLKIISEVCGFGFPLNFYVSRYTFATTITLFHGVPITSIKEMMGHKKIETTAHYARADKAVIGRDMSMLEQKINSANTA
jgi:integrase/recombinase XerD